MNCLPDRTVIGLQKGPGFSLTAACHKQELEEIFHEIIFSKQIADATALISNGDTYGVSSPRIKSTEEAKYQNSPKVYTEDAALSRMVQKELHIESLAGLRAEFDMKRNFCYKVQHRICAADLSQKEMKILYLRYFQGMSLRSLAEKMWSNKNAISSSLTKIARKI